MTRYFVRQAVSIILVSMVFLPTVGATQTPVGRQKERSPSYPRSPRHMLERQYQQALSHFEEAQQFRTSYMLSTANKTRRHVRKAFSKTAVIQSILNTVVALSASPKGSEDTHATEQHEQDHRMALAFVGRLLTQTVAAGEQSQTETLGAFDSLVEFGSELAEIQHRIGQCIGACDSILVHQVADGSDTADIEPSGDDETGIQEIYEKTTQLRDKAAELAGNVSHTFVDTLKEEIERIPEEH